jgi:hypothetical protein
MKKAKTELNDWGRAEYKRSDFGKLTRGKYARRIHQKTNVVLLDPEVSKAFPNDEAVNTALLGLIHSSRSNAGTKLKRKNKASQKKRAA